MQNESQVRPEEVKAGGKEPGNSGLERNPGNEIAALRECVARFKKQARLLLERFLRGEISATDAKAEAKRIEAEVTEAERRVNQWEAQHEGSRKEFTSEGQGAKCRSSDG